jgi:D-alanyl-D-alanine carboxypeptidase
MEFGAVSAPPPQIEARVMRLFFCIATALLSLLATPSFAVKAPAYVVIDVEAGTVLAHNEAATLWPPASVTKLMTAYVTFRALKSGQLDLDSAVVVSANALKEPPSKMGYKVGTAMTLDNALKMMIVRSANDIAVAIAETVGGSEQNFIERMNAEARRLGMASTRYHNPNGLPDELQVTTARDMAVLARALWLEFPEYLGYFKIPAIKVGSKVLRSYNKLLERFQGANGMKTGFICASGFNIVASATRSGRTVVVVLLGADSADERAEIAAKLLEEGLKPRIFRKGQSLATFRTGRSPGPAVNLRAEVCDKRDKGKDRLTFAGKSALGPRFVLMDPVRVGTGVPKVSTGASGSAPVRGIPIPRPRPPMPGGNAGLQLDPGEPAFAWVAPATVTTSLDASR